ncbi:MAG: M14 family metallopeptidase [Pseudomonadales bacterium]|nr:M14 family metallopeptidase [Pseudomonadales bacterium]
MKEVSVIFLVLALLSPSYGADETVSFPAAMMTVPELTNYQRTSTFAEVVAVVDALRQSSDLIHRETLLLTEDGKDVPLLVLARPPIATPAQARASGKPVIYIQGNIHGGEVEGKEASLIIMRDILFGDKQHLLDDQILVFVPIYNADGNDNMSSDARPSQELSPLMAGERQAHGYDLNRDGMAVETAETRALYLNVIQRWDPALLVDLHTTNGTWHGYSLTYAPSYHTAGDGATSAYTADVMLPAIAQSVKEKFNLDFGWYGGFDYRDWPPKELRTYHHAPRYLTNNMGLRNRMAILAETFAHDRFYKRVHAANVFVEEILEYTNTHGREMQRINAQADVRTASRLQQQTGAIENGIQFEMAPLEEPLGLLSYKYIPYTTPTGDTEFARSSEIVTIAGVLNYNRFEATKRATVPTAYVFPAELSQVAETLTEHGIDVAVLEQDTRFEGEVFSVTGIETQAFVQNQHRNTLLQGQYRSASQQFSAGDYYVALDNRLANLIFYLLEAQSDDGLAYWNFFDSYLQSALAQNPGDAAVVDFPVFKVLSIAAPPN